MTEQQARILIVDDHATNRLKLAMAVEALGHRPDQAENGLIGLERMRRDPYDLVLLDIEMPEMTGREVLEEMQADDDLRRLPVIVISASNETRDAIECIRKGAEDFLHRPFDPVLLRARIGASLTKKRLNDAVRTQMHFIRDMLGKFIPDTVARKIVESGGDLEPTRTVATVMMTDIVGFTAIVESHPPEQVFEMLNTYFKAILEPITRLGGIVNNFEGDALMALFNVPIAIDDHAERAVRAAMEIHDLTETQRFAGIQLRTRIGIDTGEVIAGNVGDGARLTYTVVGKTVNIAARLEQLNKERDSMVIVSERTAAQVSDGYSFLDAGSAPLRGLTEPIPIKILASKRELA